MAFASPALAALHAGDRVAINVYNHPELATQATIDSTGHVSVPVAGLVDANGAGTKELAARIVAQLAPYVRRPAVDVQLVSQTQNIFVAGGPGGVLPYLPGETLVGALGALGQTPLPGNGTVSPDQTSAHDLNNGSIDLHRVIVERDGIDSPPVDAAELVAKGEPGTLLQPGDTIKLSFKPVPVEVRGEVKQPGVAHLATTQPLSDAVIQVGGPSDNSGVGYILTRDGERSVITSSSPEYSEPAHPGDSIFVPHAVRVGVLGQVNRPGPVSLNGDNSLVSALYNAGGPGKYGDIRHVEVIHQGTERMYDITEFNHGASSDQNPILADGDTVFVPEGHKIDFPQVFNVIFGLRYLI